MAITTLDGTLAGMQPPRFFFRGATPALIIGVPYSLWYVTGIPGPGSTVATTAGGIVLSTSSAQVNGALYHTDGAANNYLARFAGIATVPGTLMLCDRLLVCGGTTAGSAIAVTTTTAQTVNTVALPARDVTGTTAGLGVMAAVECGTTMGAGTPTISLGYTNSAGTTGQSGTPVTGIQSAAVQGTFYIIAPSAGDQGVRSVQTITFSSSYGSGFVQIVLFRVLAALEIMGAWQANALDALTSGFPQLFNGTTMFLVFIPTTAGAANLFGSTVESQG